MKDLKICNNKTITELTKENNYMKSEIEKLNQIINWIRDNIKLKFNKSINELDKYEIKQMSERWTKKEKYKIISFIEETENGKLNLITDIDNFKKKESNALNLYILNKIEIQTKEKKFKIEEEISIMKKIDSKYLMKIIEYFIIKEEEKEFMCIILDYYENMKMIYPK